MRTKNIIFNGSNSELKMFLRIEFNRFLEYYKNMAELKSPSEGKFKERDRERSNQRGRNNYTRYFINLGVTDGLKPTQLIGMINDFTGMRDIEVGEIEILKNFSFFEADTTFQNEIIEGFKGKKLKKRDINLEIAEKRRGGGGGGSKPKFNSDDRKRSGGFKKSGFSRDKKDFGEKKDFKRTKSFSRDRKNRD